MILEGHKTDENKYKTLQCQEKANFWIHVKKPPHEKKVKQIVRMPVTFLAEVITAICTVF